MFKFKLYLSRLNYKEEKPKAREMAEWVKMPTVETEFDTRTPMLERENQLP